MESLKMRSSSKGSDDVRHWNCLGHREPYGMTVSGPAATNKTIHD